MLKSKFVNITTSALSSYIFIPGDNHDNLHKVSFTHMQAYSLYSHVPVTSFNEQINTVLIGSIVAVKTVQNFAQIMGYLTQVLVDSKTQLQ